MNTRMNTRMNYERLVTDIENNNCVKWLSFLTPKEYYDIVDELPNAYTTKLKKMEEKVVLEVDEYQMIYYEWKRDNMRELEEFIREREELESKYENWNNDECEDTVYLG